MAGVFVYDLVRDRLFQFLLQCIKFRGGEKFAQRDLQTITQFFDGHCTGITAFTVQNAFYRGLGHAGKVAQPVGSDVPLLT